MSASSSRLSLRISRQELVLIFITMVWGGTFLVVHRAMAHSGPFFFVGLRFATASLLLAFFFRRYLKQVTWLEIKAGALIGLSIAGGYGLQTWGMQTISSSQSAFITALYVPVVPLLQWLFLRRPPGLMAWLGILLAFTGLVLVAGPQDGSLTLNAGEIATLLSTLAIAAEIILISRYAGQVDVRRVTLIQLMVASACAFVLMIPNGESVPAMSTPLLLSALGLGAASALIQVTMNWAQRSVSPTRATVIYAGEPVWAGVVGRLAGERLPAAALLGAALIVCGVIVSELRIRRKKAVPDQAPLEP
ncbi:MULTISPECIES: DMT family transporter [Enterobacterales]|jgi:drug/metabolite transporter (DMT)-like permease|uniref:Permease of the drug/metabolite transporter (DMT) superfamily n=3 Tax=Pantoea TaxID=53335 RepID=A0A1I3RAP8_9GAMM|nr:MULTISPECIES: DMT family transporter [Enterobacterales]MRT22781.1 EamA family transporter [Enterobacteriaceae bacterium RIT697]MRT40142.1 EamA family transporter [Enterobacteriaceae bacterium RIT702]KAJ9433565.1 DMT family transporter [Pantoea sp. YR343]MBB3305048.1 drug/metabolite transporter (DMT)-like permease [Enterobacter sp. Sphag1F]MBY4950616.1 DMT family transporter [Pantoea sp. DY-17]